MHRYSRNCSVRPIFFIFGRHIFSAISWKMLGGGAGSPKYWLVFWSKEVNLINGKEQNLKKIIIFILDVLLANLISNKKNHSSCSHPPKSSVEILFESVLSKIMVRTCTTLLTGGCHGLKLVTLSVLPSSVHPPPPTTVH